MLRFDSPLRIQHEEWSALQTRLLEERLREASAGTPTPPVAPQRFEVNYLPYGPQGESGASCEIVSSYGPVELEYASIRRDCGLFDASHRALIQLSGSERLDFLDRMLTQKIADLAPGSVTRSFWLNRKGRIVADLLVANLEDRTILEMDVHAAEATFTSLDAFLFTEDVEMKPLQDSHVELQLHGPQALVVLAELVETGDPPGPQGASLVTMRGHEVVLIRTDETGEPGLDLICERSAAVDVWNHLLSWTAPGNKRGIRPIGWEAYNVGRVEGGTPLFNIDFGSDSLPHETGVVEERVHFSKGCYLGQELVARMHNLGQPKQILRAVDFDNDRLPVSGTQVFASLPGADGTPQMGPEVGMITSSTISPLLGAVPIAFAMLRYDYAEESSQLYVAAEGQPGLATVRPGLSFLPGKTP